MTEVDIIRAQRDLLFESCKKVATNKKCPDWIAKILSSAVMQAKKIQETEIDEDANSVLKLSKELGLDALVKSNKKSDSCIYKIIRVGDVIQDIQLYDVVIVRGNKQNPEGSIIHNVPATMLVTSN